MSELKVPLYQIRFKIYDCPYRCRSSNEIRGIRANSPEEALAKFYEDGSSNIVEGSATAELAEEWLW